MLNSFFISSIIRQGDPSAHTLFLNVLKSKVINFIILSLSQKQYQTNIHWKTVAHLMEGMTLKYMPNPAIAWKVSELGDMQHKMSPLDSNSHHISVLHKLDFLHWLFSSLRKWSLCFVSNLPKLRDFRYINLINYKLFWGNDVSIITHN